MANRFILNEASTFHVVTSLNNEKADPVETRVNELQVAIKKSSPLNYQL